MQITEHFLKAKLNYSSLEDRVRSIAEPSIDHGRLKQFMESIEREESQQIMDMEQLRGNYQTAYEALTHLSTSTDSQTSSSAVDSLTPAVDSQAELMLMDLSHRQANYIERAVMPGIEARTQRIKTLLTDLENGHETTIIYLHSTLRLIAAIQTDVQYRLKRDIDWMKKLSSGQNEYFHHLQQLVDLPSLYKKLVMEIMRRRESMKDFNEHLQRSMDVIEKLRAEEILKREMFMETCGLNLPPLFFKIIPSLKEKPPVVQFVTTQLEFLPEISAKDLSEDQGKGETSLSSEEDYAKIDVINDVEVDTSSTSASIIPVVDTSKTVESGAVNGEEDLQMKYKKLLDDMEQVRLENLRLKEDSSELKCAVETLKEENLKLQSVHEESIRDLMESVISQHEQQVHEDDVNARASSKSAGNGFERILECLQSDEVVKRVLADNSSDSAVIDGDSSQETVVSRPDSVVVDKSAEEAVTKVQKLVAAVGNMFRLPMISFMDFHIGDVALFMPALVNDRKVLAE